MRAMNVISLALFISVIVMGDGLSWAKSTKDMPPPKPEEQIFTGLANLQSFEVRDMEPQDFSAQRQDIPHEAIEYARTAIEQDARLHYESPAQGVLNLKCDNPTCSRIRAEVTRGEDGPVVWQYTQQYRLCPLRDLSFLPDSRKFANRIVNQLAQDYQKALKASNGRIQITEE